jgi:hypothetical protein
MEANQCLVRSIRVVLLGAAVVAAGLALPSTAHPGDLPRSSPPVTGALTSYAGHLRQGLSPTQAGRMVQLDHFARNGVDTVLLNTVLRSAEASSGSSGGFASSYLGTVGNLDGQGPLEVAEQRYLATSKQQTVQVVIRDGATGTPMWTHTDHLSPKEWEFAAGAPVGRGGRPGVLLFRDSFEAPAVITALDGRGHQLWQRSLPRRARAPQPAPAFGVVTYSSYGSYTLVDLDVALRRGSHDILQVEVAGASSSGDIGGSETGAVDLSAVSLADGALRGLPGSGTSADSPILADEAGDLDGDGLTDLLIGMGGKHHTIRALRADGRTVWSRSDAFTDDLAWLAAVPSVLRQRAGRAVAADVVVLTVPARSPAAGVLPAPATRPSITLLGGHDGARAWAKPADSVYLVERAGVPAIGLLADDSSTSGTQDVAAGTVTVVDAKGATRWRRSFRATWPKHGDSDFAFAGAFADGDLDGDGSHEGVMVLGYFSDSGQDQQLHFMRGRDGAAQTDPHAVTMAGVTPGHDDYVTVTPGTAGLVVTVLDGRSRARRFRTTVPASKGMSEGYASAESVSRHRCADVLVSGAGGGRTLVAVLASNGLPRWSLSRAGSDASLGTVVRPAKAPAVSC